AELLRPFSLEKLAYDPFIPAAAMEAIGARPAALEEIFARSDVISLHTAELPETEGMIGGELLGSMKPHATLVNTARGSVVDEEALCAVLARRPDLTAVLDVCRDEPPRAGSPLYHLPNVVLTPHIAGSLGNEVRRMADWMIEEFDAWRSGRPLRYAVEPSRLGTLA
ncbi:MAG TPA: NAD(P)-dependent oxidoreductase, partial [Candidatus Methylacidiphilales bacterium]